MIIREAKFISSVDHFEKCPAADIPEYCFIGRSNVGKSSLLNMLTGQKGLAKTSSTPGKTQTINHFLVNSEFYISDLPGYGFAKVSRTLRDKWEGMIRNYLLNRLNLMTVFVLIDSRIPPQASDLEFLNWLGKKEIPLGILFTKTDKLTKNELAKNITAYHKELLNHWEELPVNILTSSEKGLGKTELLNYFVETNKLYYNH